MPNDLKVEVVIKKYKEELLKERYRFNMGLLMGKMSALCQLTPSSWFLLVWVS